MKVLPKIIAHRGFWKCQPETTENSVQALQNAQKLFIYGSECDVKMTKDGILIVFHDDEINGLTISKTDFDELKSVQLSNGELLPTFEKYLDETLKMPFTKLVAELKPDESHSREMQMVKNVLKLIKDRNMENQIDFISFSIEICKEIKRLAPQFSVMYLEGDLSPKEIKTIGLDGIDYNYKIFLNNTHWISEAKMLGLKTNSWTVDDNNIFQQLSALGIDFITTNQPNIIGNPR